MMILKAFFARPTAKKTKPSIIIDSLHRLDRVKVFLTRNDISNFSVSQTTFGDEDNKTTAMTVKSVGFIDLAINEIEIKVYVEFWALLDIENRTFSGVEEVINFRIADDSVIITPTVQLALCNIMSDKIQENLHQIHYNDYYYEQWLEEVRY